jgi:hypothetical protein
VKGQERKVFADIANAFEDGDGDLVGSPALRRKRGKDRAGSKREMFVVSRCRATCTLSPRSRGNDEDLAMLPVT